MTHDAWKRGTCYFCGDPIDQKTVLCMADDISHRLCREAGKAVPKEERDADAARVAGLRKLPWVAYCRRDGEWSLSTWIGATRSVVLVGCDTPYGIPPEAVVYEVPAGKKASQVAEESGGIIVTVFDSYPRGQEWGAFADVPRLLDQAGLRRDCEQPGVPNGDAGGSSIDLGLLRRLLEQISTATARRADSGVTYHSLVQWPDSGVEAVPLGGHACHDEACEARGNHGCHVEGCRSRTA